MEVTKIDSVLSAGEIGSKLRGKTSGLSVLSAGEIGSKL